MMEVQLLFLPYKQESFAKRIHIMHLRSAAVDQELKFEPKQKEPCFLSLMATASA